MTSCIPAYPCCVPCDVAPAPLPQGAPLSYAANELAAMPQCCPKWQPPPKRTITVQQPPRLIVKKRTVCTTKLVHVPKIVSNMVQRDIPCITRCSKTVNIPVIRYFLEVYKEPKVTWFQSYVADPYVVNVPRIVIEPREICQTLLCQPKPQVVDVPKPTQYCMYPGGPEKLRCSLPCSPYPCPPTSGFPTCKSPACGPCSPCDPCGPCSPCGPCGPFPLCGPCGPCPPCGPCGPCPPCGPCGPCGPCPPCGPCGPCPPCGPCGPCGPPLGPCLPFDVCGSGSPCGGACGPCGLCP